jgi:hypothetical protein
MRNVEFLGALQNCENRILISSCLSVRVSAWNSSARTGRNFMKYDTWAFFEKVSRKFKFRQIRSRITGTLNEKPSYSFITSRSLLPRIRNFSGKLYRKSKHVFCVQKIFFNNRAFYEIIWKNMVELDRPLVTMWRMRNACLIPNATNTHQEHVTLTAFLLQQWSQERSSILRHRNITCLV